MFACSLHTKHYLNTNTSTTASLFFLLFLLNQRVKQQNQHRTKALRLLTKKLWDFKTWTLRSFTKTSLSLSSDIFCPFLYANTFYDCCFFVLVGFVLSFSFRFFFLSFFHLTFISFWTSSLVVVSIEKHLDSRSNIQNRERMKKAVQQNEKPKNKQTKTIKKKGERRRRRRKMQQTLKYKVLSLTIVSSATKKK